MTEKKQEELVVLKGTEENPTEIEVRPCSAPDRFAYGDYFRLGFLKEDDVWISLSTGENMDVAAKYFLERANNRRIAQGERLLREREQLDRIRRYAAQND